MCACRVVVSSHPVLALGVQVPVRVTPLPTPPATLGGQALVLEEEAMVFVSRGDKTGGRLDIADEFLRTISAKLIPNDRLTTRGAPRVLEGHREDVIQLGPLPDCLEIVAHVVQIVRELAGDFIAWHKEENFWVLDLAGALPGI